MAAPLGHKRYGGRAKGTLNKRSDSFQEVLAKNNFCAATAMIEIYQKAIKVYDSYATIYESLEKARNEQGISPIPTEDKADKYLKIAADMATRLAGFSYPTIKAIEQVKTNPLNDMTAEQKLEAMKHAVAMLELEVKK